MERLLCIRDAVFIQVEARADARLLLREVGEVAVEDEGAPLIRMGNGRAEESSTDETCAEEKDTERQHAEGRFLSRFLLHLADRRRGGMLPAFAKASVGK